MLNQCMSYHFMWVSFLKCMTRIDLTNDKVNIKKSVRKRVLLALHCFFTYSIVFYAIYL